MTTLDKSAPPMQRCKACGAEWFMVHNCPNQEAKVTKGLYQILLDEAKQLRALVKQQEQTITDLMLELAELREVRQGDYGVFS